MTPVCPCVIPNNVSIVPNLMNCGIVAAEDGDDETSIKRLWWITVSVVANFSEYLVKIVAAK